MIACSALRNGQVTAHKVQVPHVSGQLSVQVQKKDPEKKRMFKLFFIHVEDFEKKEAVRSFLKKTLVNGSSHWVAIHNL